MSKMNVGRKYVKALFVSIVVTLVSVIAGIITYVIEEVVNLLFVSLLILAISPILSLVFLSLELIKVDKKAFIASIAVIAIAFVNLVLLLTGI